MRSGRGKVKFVAGADAQGVLTFTNRPDKASVIHLDGPLQMGLQPFQKLARGKEPTQLRAGVGTPGMGAGTLATLVYLTKPGLVPNEWHPLAEIEFPGEKAVREKVTLDGRC
jgi:hypothetical protein